MSIKDYFANAIRNILRNKKNFSYIIILIICAIVTLGVYIFRYNYQLAIDTGINNNIGFRTINLYPKTELEDLGESELLSIEHVVAVYSSKYQKAVVETDLANENIDGVIEFLYGSEQALPNIVAGRTFKENEENVAICPMKFYPDGKTLLKMNDKYLIDGNDLLDKELTINYYSYIVDENFNAEEDEKFTEKFKVVGLYNNEQVVTLNNQCFVPSKDVKEIVEITNIDTQGMLYGTNVIIDELKNVETVIKKAEELGYQNIFILNQIDAQFVNFLNISSIIILLVVLFTIIVLTTSYTKKKIINELKIIGVLRTSGYNKKTVKNRYMLEILITNICIFIVGLISCLIIYSILRDTMFNTLKYMGINLTIDLTSLIIPFIIIVIVTTLVAVYQVDKKWRLNIAHLIGSEE